MDELQEGLDELRDQRSKIKSNKKLLAQQRRDNYN